MDLNKSRRRVSSTVILPMLGSNVAADVLRISRTAKNGGSDEAIKLTPGKEVRHG